MPLQVQKSMIGTYVIIKKVTILGKYFGIYAFNHKPYWKIPNDNALRHPRRTRAHQTPYPQNARADEYSAEHTFERKSVF